MFFMSFRYVSSTPALTFQEESEEEEAEQQQSDVVKEDHPIIIEDSLSQGHPKQALSELDSEPFLKQQVSKREKKDIITEEIIDLESQSEMEAEEEAEESSLDDPNDEDF